MEPFNYARVDLARRRRGLTRTALADAVGITTRGLRKIEREDVDASDQTIRGFASTLRFPLSFFYGDDLAALSPEGSSFRSLSTLTARQRDQALASGELALHLLDWIEARFDLPEPDVPRYSGIDPATAAASVREHWGLGQRPVKNVVHLLEAHGVRVFSLAEECAEVDAFSAWQGSTPLVFLNTKKNAERSRMDAAHELGHLVMHAHGGPRGRTQEDEAHAFGAAFLMPPESILASVPQGASLARIIKEKHRWKVSALNLARHCHKLNLLTEWQYRSICISLSKRGRTREPEGMRHHESSQVLQKVFQAMRAEGISKTTVANDLSIPVEELNKSIFGLALTPVKGPSTASPTGEDLAVARPRLELVSKD